MLCRGRKAVAGMVEDNRLEDKSSDLSDVTRPSGVEGTLPNRFWDRLTLSRAGREVKARSSRV